MADQIINRGGKGRIVMWLIIALILFIILVIYIYNRNMEAINPVYTG